MLLTSIGLAQRSNRRMKSLIRILKQLSQRIAEALCEKPLKIYEMLLIEEGFLSLHLSYYSFPKATVVQKVEIYEELLYTIFLHLLVSTSDFGF